MYYLSSQIGISNGSLSPEKSQLPLSCCSLIFLHNFVARTMFFFYCYGFLNVHTLYIAPAFFVSSKGLDAESITLRMRRGGRGSLSAHTGIQTRHLLIPKPVTLPLGQLLPPYHVCTYALFSYALSFPGCLCGQQVNDTPLGTYMYLAFSFCFLSFNLFKFIFASFT